MKKKSLKGFQKTRHFLERQKQRMVSDSEIIKAITTGELVQKDFGQCFQLGQLNVTIDLVNSTLITVHPGDPASKMTKLLSQDEAKKIRELIKQHEARQQAKQESISNEFLDYVAEFSIKKIE